MRRKGWRRRRGLRPSTDSLACSEPAASPLRLPERPPQPRPEVTGRAGVPYRDRFRIETGSVSRQVPFRDSPAKRGRAHGPVASGRAARRRSPRRRVRDPRLLATRHVLAPRYQIGADSSENRPDAPSEARSGTNLAHPAEQHPAERAARSCVAGSDEMRPHRPVRPRRTTAPFDRARSRPTRPRRASGARVPARRTRRRRPASRSPRRRRANAGARGR